MIGSLIKNPGGGLADCGGYLVGTQRAVELAANRLTCPGVGLEVGASLGQNRNLLRGLFYAPHTTAQALRTAHLAAYMFQHLGYAVNPAPFDRRSDIIQTGARRSTGRILQGDSIRFPGGRIRFAGTLGHARIRRSCYYGSRRVRRRIFH